MPYLIIPKYSPKREVALDGNEWLVGRQDICDVLLTHRSISRRHARIYRLQDKYIIEDLESANGTFLNGKRITKEPFGHGDEIDFGEVATLFLLSKEKDEDACLATLREETVDVDHHIAGDSSERLKFLYELAETIHIDQKEQAAIEKAFSILRAQIPGDRYFIGLTDRKGELSRHHPPDAKISRTILDKVIQQGKSIIVYDTREMTELRRAVSLQCTQVLSAVCVPITVMGRVIGGIYVDNSSRPRAYEPADAAYLTALGALLGSVLQMSASAEKLKEEERRHRCGGQLIGTGKPIRKVRELIRRFARGKATVLITGETGTGKDLVANLLHYESDRMNGSFQVLNCGGMPGNFIDAQLFGYVRGAFTDAKTDMRGYFELADGGTLFLDEIGEFPLELQTKLLRVLENMEIKRLGSEKTKKVDVRIVGATNKNLESAVSEKQFRSDFFYRINDLRIHMPPLRDHIEDIPELAEHFLSLFREDMATRVEAISDAAMKKLMKHVWPGNVRELRLVIQRALYMADGEILEPEHFDLAEIQNLENGPAGVSETGGKLKDAIMNTEIRLIIAVLTRHGGNLTRAAQEMGIQRGTLRTKIKEYGIQVAYD